MNHHPESTIDRASEIRRSLNDAASLYASARPREALASVMKVLEQDPRNGMALNIAGVCSCQLGQLKKAESYWRRALAENPDDSSSANNLGNLLCAMKRFLEAETAYRQALAVRPDYAEAHTNLGNLLRELKRFPEAEAAYRQAAALRADYAEPHYNLSLLLKETKRFSEAETACRQALAIRPDWADVHLSLGNLLKEMKRFPEAEAAYRQVLVIRPDYAEACNNLGLLFEDAKRFSEAEAAYRQALALQIDYAEPRYNLSRLLKETKRFSEAETLCRQALAIRPDWVDAHVNLGNLLKELNRFREAEATYLQALAIQPDCAEAYNNLGTLLLEVKRFREAEAAYRRALSIRPDHAEARLNLGISLFHMGRFSEGWPLYEARYEEKTGAVWTGRPALDYPQWQGESLDGKSIVIHCEQGFGDAIQFVRYLPFLKAGGARHITLICPQPLRALFNELDGADAVCVPDEIASMSAHDYWTLLLSLPLHLAATVDSIPDRIPYLRPTSDRLHAWKARLPASGLRVGLVWKGSPAHGNDRNRSLSSLAALAPLWDVPGAHFISLQKGQGEDEAANPPPGQPLIHLGTDIQDFADSAAIIAQLDLVICVDTAIAHLAGALGKPCWVLLSRVGTDWRWLEGRSDSPWYPGTMRLFRQRELNDWTPTILDVADALHRFAKATGSAAR